MCFPTPVGVMNNAVCGSFINIFSHLIDGKNKCTILNVQLSIHDWVDVIIEISS